MRRFVSDRQKIGEIGERIAEQYLVSQGYVIIERNFTVHGGEIDIVARRDGLVYFFEVKSIRTHTVSRETSQLTYNPVQNVTKSKIQRLHVAIHAFQVKHGYTKYCIQVVGVWFDPLSKTARAEIFSL